MAFEKLRRKDWLTLGLPLAVSVIAAMAVGEEHGWPSGLLTLLLFASGSLWMWRRQLRKARKANWRPWL